MLNQYMSALLAAKGAVEENPKPPRKKFKDEKEKVDYWMGLRQKYGDPYLAKRMEWLDWAEKQLPTGGSPLELSLKHAQKYKLDPEYLLSSALEEGIGNRWVDDDGWLYDHSEAYENANKNGELNGYDVDGFRSYGLDTIGDKFDALVEGGYLTKEFAQRMKTYRALNDNKTNPQWITTAAFKDDDAAMEAKAAIMAMERDNLDRYLSKKGIKLSPEARKFFVLAAYNGGIGKAQGMLDEYAQRGLLKDDRFLKEKPVGSNFGQIYNNVMPRLAGGNMFRGEGFLDQMSVEAPVLPMQTALPVATSGKREIFGYSTNKDGDLVPIYK